VTTDRLFSQLSMVDFHGEVARNIVSLRETQDLFDDLSADPAQQAVAIQVELATKPSTYLSHAPVLSRPFEEASWIASIGYPFQHWAASRFSDGRFGVWYGADSIETTVFETAYHWKTRLLADAGFHQDGIVIERKVYWVRLDAMLVELRPLVGTYPALVDPNDYSFTHLVGARLYKEGFPGLVTSSARCHGDVYATFTPRPLSSPRVACYLTYRTAGTQVIVEQAIGETWMVVPVEV
jgi:hypothetical protein